MRKWLTGFVFLIVIFSLWLGLEFPQLQLSAQTENSIKNEGDQDIESEFKLEIYDVPKSFRPDYVSILSKFISSSHEDYFLESVTSRDEVEDSTQTVEREIAPPPIEYVQYDPKRKVIVVLATPAEHKEIQKFLNQLKQTQKRECSVLYRLAFVERDIHPKLKEYPYEFHIKGKCWDDGRTRHKYPKWLDDRKQKYPNLLFSKVELDRDHDDTEFCVRGYSRDKSKISELFETLNQADDTRSKTELISHDFMKESRENLHSVLSELFPESQVESMIQSLQKTKVYQIDSEASFACESTIPGFMQTVLGDDYAVEIQCEDGLEKNGRYTIEIYVYKNDDDDESPFAERNLHLATSLTTQLNQINMLGLRDQEDRYVLLFSME